MGREVPSVGQPPAAFRKHARSKKAKATLNKTIPALLTAHPRAKKGVSSSELVVEPKPQDTISDSVKGGQDPVAKPQLELRVTDTLTAAHQLTSEAISDSGNRKVRVGILNMASMLAAGGGFLNGASSQEASLCMRTTLLPSLHDEFYRLPEVGGVYTPDVLVFRDVQGEDLDKRDRWFVDCVSAGMLRFPNITVDEKTGQGSYSSDKDRALVLEKMRAVMRIFQSKNVSKIVLGAWGCGAFGNPVGEIAAAWRKALLGSRQTNRSKKGKAETWTGIDKVVFAIKDAGLADAFGEAFGEGLLRVEDEEDNDDANGDGDVDGMKLQEMKAKIEEMRIRIEHAQSAQLKAGLSSILATLESQMPAESGNVDPLETVEDDSDDDQSDEESIQDSDT